MSMTTTPSKTPIVELNNVTIGFRQQPVISDLNFKLFPGEFVAVVGPNGSGKTTLMKSILGIQPLLSGERRLFGHKNPSARALENKIAYVPQRMSINRSVPLTVREFFSLKTKRNASQGTPVNPENDQKILNHLELEGLESKSIHQLSGGQLQRTFMAFALMGQPQLICLDEATEGLDLKSQKNFFDLLKSIMDLEKTTLLLISHDISAVSDQASRVVCLNRTLLYDGDPNSPQFHSCLHKMYGEESLIHAHHSSH